MPRTSNLDTNQKTDSGNEGNLSVGLVLIVYAALLAIAALWSWLRGDRPVLSLYASEAGPELLAAGAGLAIGILVVVINRLAVRHFLWARRLEQEFVRLLGALSTSQIITVSIASSVAEEAFFRGAMQPSLGLLPTALIFGLLHFGPGRTYVPWTIMATGMGLILGVTFEMSGSLAAPVLCHLSINFLNLRRIAARAATRDVIQASQC